MSVEDFNSVGISYFFMKFCKPNKLEKKYNNMFDIEDKENCDKLHLINQAYLLLFERTSPVITPTSQEISQDNLEQITISQPAIFNRQSVNCNSISNKKN